MMLLTKKSLTVLSLSGGVLLAASCGGKSDEPGASAGTGGESSGDGDTGDGDGDVGDGDGDVGDGDLGDGDGDQSSGGGTGGQPDGVGGDGFSDGGTSSGGASDGVGGDTGTGGDISGTGGDISGTGGDAGTVTTATLGDPCGSPGAFACAEINPKLALICGGDGEWEFRETCAGEALCDSYEGSGLGTCRVPLAECEIVTGAFCDEDDSRVVECAESGFETVVVEECGNGYGCVNGSCALVADECPPAGLYTTICSEDCGTHPTLCMGNSECENTHAAGIYLSEGAPSIFRLPTTDICSPMCNRTTYTLNINSQGVPDLAVRVSVGPGWGIITDAAECSDLNYGACAVLPPIPEGEYAYWQVWMAPDSENPVSRNVLVEAVPPGTTCD